MLFKDDTLTLDKAMQIARTYESLQQKLKEFKTSTIDTPVYNVSHKRDSYKSKPDYRKNNQPNNHLDNNSYHKVTCKYCGLKHVGTFCPAAQSEYRFFHNIGHWAAVCRNKLRPISAQSSNPTGHHRTHDHKFDELKFNEI